MLPLMFVGVSVCLTGCVNALVMDTGRALEPGEMTTTAGVGAGWQSSEITGYVTEEEEVDPDTGVVVQTRSRTSFPLTPFQFEWFFRWSKGTGSGFQMDWAVTMPTPAGLGGWLGLKWQIPLPTDVVALALVARGGGSASGTQSGGNGGIVMNASADPGLILSLHGGERHAVYVSPRVRWDYVQAWRWNDQSDATFSTDAQSWSGAVGYEFKGFEWGGIMVEGQAIYTPNTDRPDGIRLVFGFARVMPY